MKRSLLYLILGMPLLALTTSCLESEDPYNAGFVFMKPTTAGTGIYANTTADSLVFYSYGNWKLTNSNSDWCRINVTSGMGSTLNSIPVFFNQNTTGKGRQALLTITDTDRPNEAYVNLFFWQYATRGDGSLGSSADVKAITGSDGSRFELAYDNLHRPTMLRITRDGTVIRNLTLTYNDTDSLLTIVDMSKRLTSKYARDYQPKLLIGDGDTIGYTSQHYTNGMTVSANYAFNLEHRSKNGEKTIYAYLLGGQSLSADSLHCADSLRIAQVEKMPERHDVVQYKLEYSSVDNRCQSVDANQLIFGADNCDPYQLLSLFRYTRNSRILSEMKGDTAGAVVEVELNADKSVHAMTIKTTSGGTILPDIPLTYTFEY